MADNEGPPTANKEGPFTKLGAMAGVAGVVVTYLVAAVAGKWWPFEPENTNPPTAQVCSDRAMNDAVDSADRLRPPSGLTIIWEPSTTKPGRMAAEVSWQNNDPRSVTNLMEITGRFGSRTDANQVRRFDGPILPADGACGHWNRNYPSGSGQTGSTYFDGLWSGEKYCFAVNSSDEDGGNASPYPSINSPAVCEVAPQS